MHTDEYEISMGREIVHCRKVVRRLRNSILDRERKFGMTTEEFLKISEQDSSGRHCDSPQPAGPNDGIDSVRWREDYRDLRIWEQRLREYEAALRMVRDE